MEGMMVNVPEEYRILKETTRKFVERELDPYWEEVEEKEAVPERLAKKMRELGYFGLTIPVEYGGSGLGTFPFCLVTEELAKTHKGFKLLVNTNNGIGSKGLVLAGTEEQKRKYLPALARGEKIAAFALTEPEAGSDAANVQTTAVKDGDYYVLNGLKHFITHGPIADLYTVFAATDRKLKGQGGITAFVVEKGTPGLKVGRVQKTMGSNFPQQSEVIFEECRVPAANLLGKLGYGFEITTQTLQSGRLVMGATCVGTAEKLLQLCIEYSRQRVQFGRPIAERQGIQFMLADMGTEAYAAKAMVYEAAQRKDQNLDVRRESSMIKLFATEMVGRVADKAVQIFGGMGYMRELPIERFYREVRIYRIAEGTSEIQRWMVGRDLLKNGF